MPQKLQDNIKWARMEFKPSKSTVKGHLTDERFHISDKTLLTILGNPIKNLGRWYNADLKGTQQLEQLRQDTFKASSKSITLLYQRN